METKTAPIALRLADEQAGIVEGYGSTFGGSPDSYGHVITKGAFSTSLARHAAEATMPVMLWGHDASRPVGRWLSAKEDGYGLFLRGQVNLGTAAGKEAHAHLLAGDLDGLSIGVRYGPESVTKRDDGVLALSDLDLAEVSLVTLPANGRARITSVKQYAPQNNLLEDLQKQVNAAIERFAR